MRNRKPHSHSQLAGHHVSAEQRLRDTQHITRQWDAAVEDLNAFLANMEKRCARPESDLNSLSVELSEQLHRVNAFCRAMEERLEDDEQVREKQAEFRKRTDDYFGQSYLMKRARTWPRGYPGDYEIIDAAYDGDVRSDGIGRLFDRYFLESTLARAIQLRREMMRDMLAEELRQREHAQVLNIGCGPCREVLELASLIQQRSAVFTNIDFDTEALLFSAQRLAAAGVSSQMRFRQYNAVRMVNARKTIREFGYADVIYTIGLLDYLTDEILVRLLNSLYACLNPGGILIAVFKDCDHYDTEDYHWLVDWSAFLQRNAADSRELLRKAGIPGDAITASRTEDNVMVFYRVLQSADTRQRHQHEPHDRRGLAGLPTPEPSEKKQKPSTRPSWHRPEQTR